MSKNGEIVAAFEKEFAAYVGARYCIAMTNGTSTLHAALVALGVKPGDRVAVPPLTMSSTTIAVLHAGAVPVFWDVQPDTWLMRGQHTTNEGPEVLMPVSLYGLHQSWSQPPEAWRQGFAGIIDDAAQTLRKHSGAAFTSYSFQASKILSCGEGGALVTNDEELATRARSFSSLGYALDPLSPRIDSQKIRSPDYARHHSLGWNYRMSDVQARELIHGLESVDELRQVRQRSSRLYQDAIQDCQWLTPQQVPDGWTHDYWCWAVVLADGYWDGGHRCWEEVAQSIQRHGGERPYACWRLTYHEPAFEHLWDDDQMWRCDTCGKVRQSFKMPASLGCRHWGGDCPGTAYPNTPCPVAESLQPRLMQFQTNDLASAERNASALRKAIKEIGG